MLADVTHFSMVGFPVETTSTRALNQSAANQFTRAEGQRHTACDALPGSENQACVIRDPSGGELWFGLHKEADGRVSMVTLNPAFKGEGRTRLQVSGDNSDPEWAPFEISVAARFAGQETPVIFDLADPRQASLVKAGAQLTVSLTAFSYGPEIYRDETAYYAAQRKSSPSVKLAANMFIPSGTFFQKVGGALPDGATRPTAYADFAGTILKAELRTNSSSNGKFWSVLARTYTGTTVDVVIDPSSIKVEPKPGGILAGRFWLSGRIVAEP